MLRDEDDWVDEEFEGTGGLDVLDASGERRDVDTASRRSWRTRFTSFIKA